ncbi:MAG: gamma-glutamylcyclotransferase family protein, partial [Arenicellales bacterium]
MNLFVYGTLMDADIMGRVTGSAYQSQEATLQEYSRRTVRGEVYPAIIKQCGCSVDGVVYFNISLVDIE